MNQLLRFKDLILQFVGRYEIYVMAVVRFVIGYAAFRLIVVNTGYMTVLSEYPIALILALVCCFLPSGVMLFAGVVLILLEFYALSPIVSLIMLIVFLIMFCAYLRFTTRKGLYAILTPVLSVLGVPYTMPVATGLFGEPYAVISVICGEITYFMMQHVTENSALYVVTEEGGSTAVITRVVTDLLLDPEMYLFLAGFAAAAVVTFCICKLPVVQSHLIAAAFGIVTQMVVIGGGEVALGNPTAVTGILFGCVVSFLILLIVSFFTHNLNYTRVENVQFEDDEYYYYVRAIPKRIAAKKRRARRAASIESGRSPREDRSGAVAAAVGEELARQRAENAHSPVNSKAELAAAATQQRAEAEAAERAAAEAAAERAAAAAQAISKAAGQGSGDAANLTSRREEGE